MGLSWLGLSELTIEDERSFAHVQVYHDLKRWLSSSDVRFATLTGPRSDHALVLNLAFWRPGDIAEILPDDVLTADQVTHNAWHAMAAHALGGAARSARGLLLAEAIASAFDIYLVGRLLGHAPESQFLNTQVVAMADAAAEAGLEDKDFEALIHAASEQPEKSFEDLRQLLFDVSFGLLGCDDVEQAAEVFERHEQHRFSSLLHHYELSTWVLFARCHGVGDGGPAEELDRVLRATPDSMRWLCERWMA